MTSDRNFVLILKEQWNRRRGNVLKYRFRKSESAKIFFLTPIGISALSHSFTTI